jgi:uncharacterized protein YcfL
MRLIQPLATILSISAALLIAGCAKPPGRAKPDPVSEAEYPQISAQGWLDNRVAYGKPTVRYGEDQPLEVSAPVRLLMSNPRKVQYRFIFLAPDGKRLTPQMDWRYKELPARAQTFLEGSAMSTEAKDWRLEIRPFQ